MDEIEWLCFEKSGRIADYLAYCQSASGKFADYKSAEGQEKKHGADLYPDGDGAERSSGGRF